jgi:hypothetical protein
VEFLPAGGRAALPGYAPDSSAGSLEGSNHEIPRSADRDPGPLVYWHRRIWDAQAADYCRPCSRSSSERAAAIARNRARSDQNSWLIATSAAIATAGDQHPAHGMLLRASEGATEIGFEPGCETIGASVAGTPM